MTGNATSLAPKASYSDDDIRHFLRRTHFGVRASEFETAKEMGLDAYIDQVLEMPTVGSTSWEQAAEELLVNETDPPGLEGMFPSTSDLARWWLYLMMHSEHPFQEELALFWHDHFAVSSSILSSSERHWMRTHVDLFRARGTGSLRDLLVEVSRDSAMAKWLDQTNNDQFDVNENYAREFWELFTLGIDNGYSLIDIRESAEAHTGANIVEEPVTGLRYVEFNPEDHADGFKSILGQTVSAQHGAGGDEHDDIEEVVDITLSFVGGNGGGAAEHVVKSILQHYYNPEPPSDLKFKLAKVMRDENYQMKAVFRTLFKSEAFYSDTAKEGIVKSPVERTVGFMRTTGLLVPVSTLDNSLRASRQRPTQPPDVDGWESGEELLSSIAMVELANMAADAIENRTYQEEDLGLDMATLLPSGPKLAADVVDHWALLLGVELTDAERDLLVEYMDTRRESDGTVVPSLFTAGDPDHLDERLRGLLYILPQHPSYLLR